jgi:hypothetical protein
MKSADLIHEAVHRIKALEAAKESMNKMFEVAESRVKEFLERAQTVADRMNKELDEIAVISGGHAYTFTERDGVVNVVQFIAVPAAALDFLNDARPAVAEAVTDADEDLQDAAAASRLPSASEIVDVDCL